MHKPNSENPNLTKMTKTFLNEIAALERPPIYEMPPHEARKFLQEIQGIYDYDEEAKVSDIDIHTTYAGKVPVRIVRPAEEIGLTTLPVILYIHGGGWVMGDKHTHNNLIKKLANKTNCVVIFPEYTPSPEAIYPQALNQVYGVLEYLYENPEEFGINRHKIIVAGDSVGGNLAAAVTLKAKTEHGPKISLQVLLYPVTDAKMSSKSYEEFSEGPWLSKKAMEYFWDAYLPDKDLGFDPYVSPMYASLEDLKGLPPTLLITNENDVLRDEGEEYGHRLTEAGVEVMSARINGTFHDFLLLNGLSETAPYKLAFTVMSKIIKKTIH